MKWTSVKDDLPIPGQIILSFNPVTRVNQTVFYTANGKPVFKLLCWNDLSGEWYPEVTHWMPLPEPPEGK